MFFGDNTRLPNDTANMYNWSYKAVDMVGIITSLEQEKSGLFTNQRFFFLHSVEKTYEIFVFLQNEINRNNYECAPTAL